MAKIYHEDQIKALDQRLKSGSVRGAYLFCGEEEYLKRHYLTNVRNLLVPDPDLGVFDAIRIDASRMELEALPAHIEQAIATPPMMQAQKLVEVHQTDFELLKKTENKAVLQDLCEVLKRVKNYDYAAVVFVCTSKEFFTGYKWDQSALYRSLSAVANVVLFARQSEAKLAPWCRRHFRHERVQIDETVTPALLAQCGNDMQTLYYEIQKLCMWAKARNKEMLTAADVARVCIYVSREENFGLNNALKRRDVTAALEQYRLQRTAKVEPTVLFAQISKLVGDLWQMKRAQAQGMRADQIAASFHVHQYVVQTTLSAARLFDDRTLDLLLEMCIETDRLLKSAPIPPDVLLERLIAAFGTDVPVLAH